MDIPISVEAYDRAVIGGALEILQNMYSEKQPATDGRNHTVRSGPGITQYQTGYDGNLRDFLADDNLFDGDIFSVHGGNVYRTDEDGNITLLGTVNNAGRVTMAASDNEILICVDPALYSYNGVDFVAVALPGFGVSSVAEIANRFVALRNDTDTWYWSDALDGRTWDGLNFKTAEGKADLGLRIYTTQQYVIVFGSKTTEIYALNTNPRTPADLFYRIGSGAMEHGIFAPLSVAQEDAFVFWLSDKKNIYVATGFRPNKISTSYIHDLIKTVPDDDLAGAYGYTYTQNGETFYVFTVPGHFTFTYDLGDQKWQTRTTRLLGSWRAERAIRAFNRVIAANTSASDLLEIDLEAVSDLDEPIVQEFTAAMPIRSPLVINDMTLDAWADRPAYVGTKFTETGGRIWTSFQDARIPSPSYEDTQAMFRGLGTARAPERVQKFRISEPCNIMVRGVRINDGIT